MYIKKILLKTTYSHKVANATHTIQFFKCKDNAYEHPPPPPPPKKKDGKQRIQEYFQLLNRRIELACV
jgi:hypothetical protein